MRYIIINIYKCYNIFRKGEFMDFELLREDLMNYFGTAGMMGEVIAAESASDEELIKIAKMWNLKVDIYLPKGNE
jgi:hypothetical protein